MAQADDGSSRSSTRPRKRPRPAADEIIKAGPGRGRGRPGTGPARHRDGTRPGPGRDLETDGRHGRLGRRPVLAKELERERASPLARSGHQRTARRDRPPTATEVRTHDSASRGGPIERRDRSVLSDDDAERGPPLRRGPRGCRGRRERRPSRRSKSSSHRKRRARAASPVRRRCLASRRVSAAEKDQILIEVFGDRVSSLVLRFLRVLNRHGRLGLLPSLAREAAGIWDRRNHRVPVSRPHGRAA